MGEKPGEADEAAQKASGGRGHEEQRAGAGGGGGDPAGIAVGDEGVRRGTPETNPPRAERATNLNSSRSNIYRTAAGGGEAGDAGGGGAAIPGKPTKEQ